MWIMRCVKQKFTPVSLRKALELEEIKLWKNNKGNFFPSHAIAMTS